MPSTVLVGAQWGDEGKGKITDLIASDYDYVVRFQGGNNAGHTVIHGDKKLALHLMPSGVMYENAVPVIGNGVVVDPGVLVKEMAMLEAEGLTGAELLWLAAADSDPRRDVTVVGEVVVVDARSKRPGVEGHPARFPNVAVASSATVERVDARWAEYGLGETMASPSERYRRLLLSDKAAW